MKEFKENDIISLKLVSGEEVIGKFKSKTADATTIEKALVMMHGPKGLAFGTFFATAMSTASAGRAAIGPIRLASGQLQMESTMTAGVPAVNNNNIVLKFANGF